MTKVFLLILVASTIFAFGSCKHIHPRSLVEIEEDYADDTKTVSTDIDGMPIEVIRRIKPSRFVPVNNVLFFKRYTPCEDGFERDLLGVCREVWD